jgi:uncharacterized membrane protein
MPRIQPRKKEVENLANIHDRGESNPGREIEATTGERLLTMVGGGALAWYGLTRRSLLGLATAAIGYEIFKDKRDGCVKVVLQPTG